MPSPAIGVLSALIRRDAPDIDLNPCYAYLDVWEDLGPLYGAIARVTFLGESLYVAHLHPDSKQLVQGRFGRAFIDRKLFPDPTGSSPEGEFLRIHDLIGRHVDRLAQRLASQRADVVGFTTSIDQLFSSLAVASRLKELNPSVRIVLGGAMVRYGNGRAVLTEYPFVDYVVQGEGEVSLIPLLRRIERGDSAGPGEVESVGVLSRTALGESGASGLVQRTYAEVADLSGVPIPDYREYRDRAEELGIAWRIPIEGSRGCWWDRTRRTKDPLDKCAFCSDTPGTYRRKDAERIADEMDLLCKENKTFQFLFLDSIVHPAGIRSTIDVLKKRRRRYFFFHELRANLHPHDLASLYEAGCTDVQIGIEGLSTSYLKRLGKGTKVIQNLQAMKICYEVGIRCNSYLLTDFPGATEEEVEETVRNIERYAIAYWPPLLPNKFELRAQSPVHLLPGHFGIRVRKARGYQEVLPDEVCERLELPILEFDCQGKEADWSRVLEACKRWAEFHQKLVSDLASRLFLWEKPLSYHDSGDLMEIYDKRDGVRSISLEGLCREVYLYCMEIRERERILGRFSGREGAEEIQGFLEDFVENRLMFVEGDEHLSLAVAVRPEDAMGRIRTSWQEEHGTIPVPPGGTGPP